ncbi:hypothetical protein BO71DRAFT_228257 [Aspergillus ellipticus CBS 707.79]|uniref:Uncharacterized protein n=1 Tax=Aspergillus ellipticus CBS 707.79 TaxID=1448320 RepID=A0A319ETL2_9EURO|nr:hypothetical protein BO71DRAFT_228257 [Aspergillus ellipticus CBS 707.79]
MADQLEVAEGPTFYLLFLFCLIGMTRIALLAFCCLTAVLRSWIVARYCGQRVGRDDESRWLERVPASHRADWLVCGFDVELVGDERALRCLSRFSSSCQWRVARMMVI